MGKARELTRDGGGLVRVPVAGFEQQLVDAAAEEVRELEQPGERRGTAPRSILDTVSAPTSNASAASSWVMLARALARAMSAPTALAIRFCC